MHTYLGAHRHVTKCAVPVLVAPAEAPHRASMHAADGSQVRPTTCQVPSVRVPSQAYAPYAVTGNPVDKRHLQKRHQHHESRHSCRRAARAGHVAACCCGARAGHDRLTRASRRGLAPSPVTRHPRLHMLGARPLAAATWRTAGGRVRCGSSVAGGGTLPLSQRAASRIGAPCRTHFSDATRRAGGAAWCESATLWVLASPQHTRSISCKPCRRHWC